MAADNSETEMLMNLGRLGSGGELEGQAYISMEQTNCRDREIQKRKQQDDRLTMKGCRYAIG